MSFAGFLREYRESLLLALGQHLRLVGVALVIAVPLGLLLAVAAHRRPRLARPILGAANLIQTIPSIALFALMIPILSMVNRGIGAVPATIALILYAQLPIIRNTVATISAVPHTTIDAARGMGMTEAEILRRITLPLAAPGIVAGIRLAATLSIGVAAIATYIGAGGLGLFIARGIATTWETMTLAGALGVALLALAVELLLELLERALTPRGLRNDHAGEARP
jgi:osmoprotectant transport system permease protein